MANQRNTFAKRQREQNLRDKARDKAERLAARRAEARAAKNAPIAPAAAPTSAVASNAPAQETPRATNDSVPASEPEGTQTAALAQAAGAAQRPPDPRSSP